MHAAQLLQPQRGWQSHGPLPQSEHLTDSLNIRGDQIAGRKLSS